MCWKHNITSYCKTSRTCESGRWRGSTRGLWALPWARLRWTPRRARRSCRFPCARGVWWCRGASRPNTASWSPTVRLWRRTTWSSSPRSRGCTGSSPGSLSARKSAKVGQCITCFILSIRRIHGGNCIEHLDTEYRALFRSHVPVLLMTRKNHVRVIIGGIYCVPICRV